MFWIGVVIGFSSVTILFYVLYLLVHFNHEVADGLQQAIRASEKDYLP